MRYYCGNNARLTRDIFQKREFPEVVARTVLINNLRLTTYRIVFWFSFSIEDDCITFLNHFLCNGLAFFNKEKCVSGVILISTHKHYEFVLTVYLIENCFTCLELHCFEGIRNFRALVGVHCRQYIYF